MYNTCEVCGKELKQKRKQRICWACYGKGHSVRTGICPDCGKETPTRNHIYCHECREVNRRETKNSYRSKRMAGLERYRMMKVAEKPLSEDLYARTHEPISDEEYAAKVEKLRALMQADVHIGSCGRPTRWRPPGAEHGGFGALAHQHMRGAEAGTGMDRQHTVHALESQETRRRG